MEGGFFLRGARSLGDCFPRAPTGQLGGAEPCWLSCGAPRGLVRPRRLAGEWRAGLPPLCL